MLLCLVALLEVLLRIVPLEVVLTDVLVEVLDFVLLVLLALLLLLLQLLLVLPLKLVLLEVVLDDRVDQLAVWRDLLGRGLVLPFLRRADPLALPLLPISFRGSAGAVASAIAWLALLPGPGFVRGSVVCAIAALALLVRLNLVHIVFWPTLPGRLAFLRLVEAWLVVAGRILLLIAGALFIVGPRLTGLAVLAVLLGLNLTPLGF